MANAGGAIAPPSPPLAPPLSFLFTVVRIYFQLSEVVGTKLVIAKSGGDRSPTSPGYMTPMSTPKFNCILQ